MRRKRIIQLWLCLLCLLPLQSMAQTLEYWFDDHYDQLGTTSIATTDAEQELSLDLRDNTKFPFGFHRLNMRVIIGGKPSSVYTSHVLKLSAGTASKIEYWVDDDQAHSKTVDSETPNNGSTYQFIGNLDLSDVTPGHHRLYYRAVSNSGRTATAVSCTPILVKSKYYVENVEELKVTKRTQWFDNEEPETITLSPSENIYRWEKDFDTRKLSDGQHTLHMQFGNSAGLWSSPLDVTFNKTKVKEPAINVNAGVFDGTLKMSFNTVPFGYRYTVGRKYPSGERRIVDQFKTESYPATLTAFDSPGRGTYTYYVIGEYYDADGKRQEVRSQDIEATFDEVASNVERGGIFGKVMINGRNSYGIYTLYINGVKEASQSEFEYKLDYIDGTFSIWNIPYGTEVTIGIKCNKYKFNDQTLIVDENTKNRSLVFNGVKSEEEEEEEYIPSDRESDIALNGDIHILPNAFEVKVKNLSTEPWSGNLKVVVISKDVKDYYDKVNSSEGLSIWETVFAPNAYYKDASYYTTAVDMPVNLEKSEEKILSLIISDMPKYGKNEYYYLYVFSKKDGATLTKTLAGYDNSNPQTLKFDPSDFGLAENFSHFMKKYAEVLKYVKKFAAWGDPFGKQIAKIEEKAFDNFVDGFEKGEFDFVDLYADAEDAVFKSVGLLSSYIYDTNRWVTKMKKDIHYDALTNFEKLYNNVSGIYNAMQADDNHKFFELAKCVLSVAKAQKLLDDPVVKCYTTYFEVGEAMLGAVERLHNEYKGMYVWKRLISGEGIYKIKVRKYTGSNKKIEYFNGKDFYPHDNISHEGQIESISIKLKAPGLEPVECTDYKVELNNDGITITDVKFPLKDNSEYATTEAWMTINWKNDRVTHVPLLDKHFVKLRNFSQASTEPLTMTVELQSETYMNHRRIANQLTFVEP